MDNITQKGELYMCMRNIIIVFGFFCTNKYEMKTSKVVTGFIMYEIESKFRFPPKKKENNVNKKTIGQVPR